METSQTQADLCLDGERVLFCRLLVDAFSRIPELRDVQERYETAVLDGMVVNAGCRPVRILEVTRSLILFGEACVTVEGVIPCPYVEVLNNSLYLWMSEDSLISILASSGGDMVDSLSKEGRFVRGEDGNVFLSLGDSAKLVTLIPGPRGEPLFSDAIRHVLLLHRIHRRGKMTAVLKGRRDRVVRETLHVIDPMFDSRLIDLVRRTASKCTGNFELI